jgi:hypothetical protein
VLIQPRRGMGDLHADVVIEEAHEDALQITEHPVEQGAAVNDHAFKKPEIVTIRGGASDSTAGAGDGAARTFYEKLLDLQARREPFDIVTGKRLYKNMLLESLSAVTDVNTENALLFTAQCREVIIVAAQAALAPPRKNHANPAKTSATSDKGQKQPRDSIFNAGSGGGGHQRAGGAAPGYGG